VRRRGRVWKEGVCERRGRWKERGCERRGKSEEGGEDMEGKGGGECGRREDVRGGGGERRCMQ